MSSPVAKLAYITLGLTVLTLAFPAVAFLSLPALIALVSTCRWWMRQALGEALKSGMPVRLTRWERWFLVGMPLIVIIGSLAFVVYALINPGIGILVGVPVFLILMPMLGLAGLRSYNALMGARLANGRRVVQTDRRGF